MLIILITITLVLSVLVPGIDEGIEVKVEMQQDQLVEFFTGLVILVALLMTLAVMAIPELVSMLEENYLESSEFEFLNSRTAAIEMLNGTAGSLVPAGPVTDVGSVYTGDELSPILMD